MPRFDVTVAGELNLGHLAPAQAVVGAGGQLEVAGVAGLSLVPVERQLDRLGC